MIVSDGYSIEQYSKQNKLVITLPQTMRTCTNTVGQISDRRDILSEPELVSILSAAKAFYTTDMIKESINDIRTDQE